MHTQNNQPGPVDLRISDDTLRVRSARAAARYLGAEGRTPLRDSQGYVDTGDVVACIDSRCHIAGRREGVINVGGRKIWPAEVEAVINTHPLVQGSAVRARHSPITGQLIVAEVVLAPDAGAAPAACDAILADCRRALPAHKVPAILRVVTSLPVAPSGKLQRRDA